MHAVLPAPEVDPAGHAVHCFTPILAPQVEKVFALHRVHEVLALPAE